MRLGSLRPRVCGGVIDSFRGLAFTSIPEVISSRVVRASGLPRAEGFGGPISKRRSENLAQLMFRDDAWDCPENRSEAYSQKRRQISLVSRLFSTIVGEGWTADLAGAVQ